MSADAAHDNSDPDPASAAAADRIRNQLRAALFALRNPYCRIRAGAASLQIASPFGGWSVDFESTSCPVEMPERKGGAA